jgi:hypothetical protein
MRTLFELTMRRPQDLGQVSWFVHEAKVGSFQAAFGANGVSALGLSWKYLRKRQQKGIKVSMEVR